MLKLSEYYIAVVLLIKTMYFICLGKRLNARQPQAFSASQTNNTIKLYEHFDGYELCADMHVWPEAAGAFGLGTSIEIKKEQAGTTCGKRL